VTSASTRSIKAQSLIMPIGRQNLSHEVKRENDDLCPFALFMGNKEVQIIRDLCPAVLYVTEEASGRCAGH
jgi:hypothetical protein